MSLRSTSSQPLVSVSISTFGVSVRTRKCPQLNQGLRASLVPLDGIIMIIHLMTSLQAREYDAAAYGEYGHKHEDWREATHIWSDTKLTTLDDESWDREIVRVSSAAGTKYTRPNTRGHVDFSRSSDGLRYTHDSSQSCVYPQGALQVQRERLQYTATAVYT